jgi:predicted Zn-dependent protease
VNRFAQSGAVVSSALTSQTGRWRWRRWLWLAVPVLSLLGVLGYYVAGIVRADRAFAAAKEAIELHDLTQARAQLKRCLQIRPGHATAQLLAASVARRLGDYEDAEHQLRTYEALSGPADELTRERTLLRAQREGPSPEDDRYLRSQAEQGQVESVIVLEALTLGYHQAQHVTATMHCANELLQCDPEHVKGWLAHGWALEQLNRIREAVVDYERAVKLDPESIAARLYLAELLLYFTRASEALVHLDWLRQRQPDNPAVQYGLARCYHELGNRDQAAHILDALLESNPDEPNLLDLRGQVALAQGKPAEAEPFLRQALELEPFRRGANFSLSQCLQRLGQTEEARQYLQNVDRIDADMKRLAELYDHLVKRARTSEECYEAGIISLRLGRMQEGERWLLTAVTDNPAYISAHTALADFYARRGDRARADYHRQQVLRRKRSE